MQKSEEFLDWMKKHHPNYIGYLCAYDLHNEL